MVTHKKTGQKLTKIDRSKRKPKKTLADVGKDLHAAAAKAGGSLSISKGLGDVPPPKQPALPAPGMAPPHYAELGGLAEAIFEKREKAKLASREKKAADLALRNAMKRLNVPHYVDRGLNIEMSVDTVDRVKVKKFTHRKEKRSKMFGRGR